MKLYPKTENRFSYPATKFMVDQVLLSEELKGKRCLPLMDVMSKLL
ncbi:hypothetical protein ACJJI3_09620 [Microbulbifer sp. ZKSA004]